MKSISITVQKVNANVKVDNRQTNKQTGQKQYAPDHSIRGHKTVNHFILRNMYRAGIELMIPGSRSRCSNHFAMKDLQIDVTIFPIYRQPIYIINFNMDEPVLRHRNSSPVCQQC